MYIIDLRVISSQKSYAEEYLNGNMLLYSMKKNHT